MSAADSEAAVARIAAKVEDLGNEGFGAYAFLVLGLLAWNAPEVLHYIFDRADSVLDDQESRP